MYFLPFPSPHLTLSTPRHLQLTDANIFVILYAVTSIYFAGVMVRLMLVLAPIMCIMGGEYPPPLSITNFTGSILVSSLPERTPSILFYRSLLLKG